MIPIIEQAKNHFNRIAIYSSGKSYTYEQLIESSGYYAKKLLNNKDDLREERVAFMVKPGFNYVMVQWGIWQAGGVAVPLDINSPIELLQNIINETKPLTLVIDKDFAEMVQSLLENHQCKVITIDTEQTYYSNQTYSDLNIDLDRMALILYKSDNIKLTKGVVITHANIYAQINSLVKSLEWKKNDYTLSLLPLHQIQGIIDVVCCSLWVGACCEFLFKFNEANIFQTFGEGKVTLFMADSNIYNRLIKFWNEIPYREKLLIQEKMEHQRLMVNTSTLMSVSMLHKWKKISGQTLIERYGMTETGMVFSNPLKGKRNPGYVGKPLPKVQVRIADENNKSIGIGSLGEIQVKGPNVFKMYWNKEQETKDAFTKDGWFRTGDIGIIENDNFKLLGKDNADIITLEGNKISALEIEQVLKAHKNIIDCSVIGLKDESLGKVACAIIVPKLPISENNLKRWLKNKLDSDKIPKKFMMIDKLPKNSSGKISKGILIKQFQEL